MYIKNESVEPNVTTSIFKHSNMTEIETIAEPLYFVFAYYLFHQLGTIKIMHVIMPRLVTSLLCQHTVLSKICN